MSESQYTCMRSEPSGGVLRNADQSWLVEKLPAGGHQLGRLTVDLARGIVVIAAKSRGWIPYPFKLSQKKGKA